MSGSSLQPARPGAQKLSVQREDALLARQALRSPRGPTGTGRVRPRRGSTFSRLGSLTYVLPTGFAPTVLGLGEPRRRLYKEGRGGSAGLWVGATVGLGVLCWGRPAASSPCSHAEV